MQVVNTILNYLTTVKQKDFITHGRTIFKLSTQKVVSILRTEKVNIEFNYDNTTRVCSTSAGGSRCGRACTRR